MPVETIEDKDVIPFSVAEMEFRTAPAVIEALKRVADMGTLGYMGDQRDTLKRFADG